MLTQLRQPRGSAAQGGGDGERKECLPDGGQGAQSPHSSSQRPGVAEQAKNDCRIGAARKRSREC